MLLELEFRFQMNTFLTRCQDVPLTEIKVHLFPLESVEAGQISVHCEFLRTVPCRARSGDCIIENGGMT
jgi:hypothetical protein